jgi:hypothetical protein
MKNPLLSNDKNLDWWAEQAAELLGVKILSVGTGPRTTLRCDKNNTRGMLTVGYADIRDYSHTDTGRWIISRLITDDANNRPNPLIQALLAAVWILLIVSAATTFTDQFATALALLLTGLVAAICHVLYLRHKIATAANNILTADRTATLDIGQPAALTWFNDHIDGIHRTPLHQLAARRSLASLPNRAHAVGLEVSPEGEVTAE